MLFNFRDADFFGGAGIDGGFKNDDGALPEVAGHQAAGADQRGEVWLVRFVNRGGHGDDEDIGGAEFGRVCRAGQFGCCA